MTELDPNIILQAKQPQIASPFELASGAMQLRNLGLQGQNQQISLEQNQRALKDQKTIADLYRANVDPTTGAVNHAGIAQGLAQAGLGDKIPAYQQQVATAAKDTTAASAADFDLQQKKLTNVNNRISALIVKPDLSRQDVIDQINQLTDQHSLDPATRDQMIATIPQDPRMLKDFLVRKGLETLDASKQIETRLSMAPKYNEQDTGATINQGTVDPLSGTRTAGATNVVKTMTPDQAAKVKLLEERGTFTATSGDLLAALAARGVSLPAGMRSKEQQIATVNGLLRKYPNMTPDEIAENIGNGQINFGSDKKAATVAAGQEGKVSTAVNELSTFGDQALAASANVPRGSFVPVTKLLQMADSSISDPNLLTLKLKLNALNNAYNVLSARGGTDAASREHVARLFSSANSQEGVEALVKGLKEEGAGAQASAAKASHVGRTTDSSTPADIQKLLDKHGGGK